MKLVLENTILATNAKLAKGFFERLIGLMFKKKLEHGNALIIPYCNWIHTFFMRFPIDVIYINEEYKIVDSIIALKPWNITSPRIKAQHVIELPNGSLSNIEIKKGVLVRCID